MVIVIIEIAVIILACVKCSLIDGDVVFDSKAFHHNVFEACFLSLCIDPVLCSLALYLLLIPVNAVDIGFFIGLLDF